MKKKTLRAVGDALCALSALSEKEQRKAYMRIWDVVMRRQEEDEEETDDDPDEGAEGEEELTEEESSVLAELREAGEEGLKRNEFQADIGQAKLSYVLRQLSIKGHVEAAEGRRWKLL